MSRLRFIEKLKKARSACDRLQFEVPSIFTLEDIRNCLSVINRLKFKGVAIETNYRTLELLGNIKRLKMFDIILRLDRYLLSRLGKVNYKIRKRIQKVCKLRLEICNSKDLDILKKLELISHSLRCRNIIIGIRDKKFINFPFALNAIPIISDYYRKQAFLIELRNINKIYFNDSVPLDNIKLLEIEPNNGCNLRCSFCPVGRKERKIYAPMEFSVFKMIIDQFSRVPPRVHLWGRGEPFLNPNIFMMVKYLKEKNNPCTVISTNGHFLPKENIYKLIDSRLDKLIISVDSFKKKTYEKLRRGGNFDLVFKNLESLSKIKRAIPAKPVVFLQFIITKDNEGEITSMKRITDSLGFTAEFKSLASAYPKFLPSSGKFRRNEWLCDKGNESINFCPAPWERMAVSCDGKATICCKALDSKPFDRGSASLIVGDFHKESLEDIWNGRKYRGIRKQMVKDKHKIGCPIRCPNPDLLLTSKIMDDDSGPDNRVAICR